MLGFCLSLVIVSFWAGRITLNLTDSMPIGLWRLKAVPALDESYRGRVVSFCPPDTEIFKAAKRQGILHEGRCEGGYMPLLKEIRALPGDVIEYSDGFSVNGEAIPNSEIHAVSLGNISMPIFRRAIVPAGKVWLIGSHSGLSFDSRYFGFVDHDRLVGLAEPLFIFR